MVHSLSFPDFSCCWRSFNSRSNCAKRAVCPQLRCPVTHTQHDEDEDEDEESAEEERFIMRNSAFSSTLRPINPIDERCDTAKFLWCCCILCTYSAASTLSEDELFKEADRDKERVDEEDAWEQVWHHCATAAFKPLNNDSRISRKLSNDSFSRGRIETPSFSLRERTYCLNSVNLQHRHQHRH